LGEKSRCLNIYAFIAVQSQWGLEGEEGSLLEKLGIVSNGECKALILKPSRAALSQSNSFQPWDVGSR